MGYKGNFSGAQIDEQISKIESGQVVIDNTDADVTDDGAKPVSGAGIFKAISEAKESLEAIIPTTEDIGSVVVENTLSTLDLESKKPVDSNAVSDRLSKITDIDLSNALIGFYNLDTNSINENNTFKHISVEVSKGDVVTYSGKNGGPSMAMIVVFNASNSRIRYYDKGDGSYSVKEGRVVITDESASKIIFTYYSSTISPVLQVSSLVNISELSSSIDGLVSTAEDYKDTRKEFITKVSPNLWDGSTEDYVIDTSGKAVVITSWTENKSTGFIPVEPNAYYYLSGRLPTKTRSVRCVDASKTIPMKVLSPANSAEFTNWFLPNVDATAETINGMFKTPANAKFFQATISTDEGTDYESVMLEYVGKEYDADFRPSAYQPYDQSEVINPKRLPKNIPNTNSDMAVSRRYPLKVLLIGSSHGMNSISQFTWICYKSGFNVTVGNVYKGSLTLQQVAEAINNSTSIGGWFKVFRDGKWVTKASTIFDDVIKEDNWDFIIVQRSASDDNVWNNDQSTALSTIVKRINEVADGTPTILFNSGFADPASDAEAQKTMTNTIMSSAMEMQLEHQIEIIPLATAIQNARGTMLANIGAYTLKDMCYDSQHLDYGIGCYVASATIAQTILSKFGWDILTMKGYGTYEEAKSFVDTLVDTGGESVAYTEPTADTMHIAKLCAKAAYLKPLAVNDKLAELFPLS